eukprot:s538_g13.t1
MLIYCHTAGPRLWRLHRQLICHAKETLLRQVPLSVLWWDRHEQVTHLHHKRNDVQDFARRIQFPLCGTALPAVSPELGSSKEVQKAARRTCDGKFGWAGPRATNSRRPAAPIAVPVPRKLGLLVEHRKRNVLGVFKDNEGVYHNDFPARRFFANNRGLYITEPMDEETARAKARNLMALGLEPPRFHLFARLAQDSLDSGRLEQELRRFQRDHTNKAKPRCFQLMYSVQDLTLAAPGLRRDSPISSPCGVTIVLVQKGMRFIAFTSQFTDVTDVVIGLGRVFVLSRGGADGNSVLFELREKPLEERLDVLVRKRMFEWAAEVALSCNAAPEVTADIYRQHGDALFEKRAYDQALGVYVKTVELGLPLEPSYVVERYLDAQRIGHVAQYLKKLHEKDAAGEALDMLRDILSIMADPSLPFRLYPEHQRHYEEYLTAFEEVQIPRALGLRLEDSEKAEVAHMENIAGEGFLPRTTLAAVFARAAYGALMRQETRLRPNQRAAQKRKLLACWSSPHPVLSTKETLVSLCSVSGMKQSGHFPVACKRFCQGAGDRVRGFLGGAARSAAGTWDAEAHTEAFVELTGAQRADIVKAQWNFRPQNQTERPFEPAYVVFWVHRMRWLVLAVRGSCEWSAVLTDVAAEESLVAGGLAHSGMARAARWILSTAGACMASALQNIPEYRLICTGHSLGADVAELVAIMLREGDTGAVSIPKSWGSSADPEALDAFLNVEPVLEKGYKADAGKNDLGTDYPVAMRKAFAYGFGASPTFGPVLLNFHMIVSPELASRCASYVMSTAFDADYITRVSVFGIDKLILQLTDARTGPLEKSERSAPNMAKQWIFQKLGRASEGTSTSPRLRAFGAESQVPEVLCTPGRLLHMDCTTMLAAHDDAEGDDGEEDDDDDDDDDSDDDGAGDGGDRAMMRRRRRLLTMMCVIGTTDEEEGNSFGK